MVKVLFNTKVVQTAKTATRTKSNNPSCQFMNNVIGNRMTNATKAAKWLLKNQSYNQDIELVPSSMTLSTRPE